MDVDHQKDVEYKKLMWATQRGTYHRTYKTQHGTYRILKEFTLGKGVSPLEIGRMS